MKAGRGKFSGRGGRGRGRGGGRGGRGGGGGHGEVVEEVCPNGAVEVLDVVCRGEVCPSGARGGAGRGMPGRGMPGRGRGGAGRGMPIVVYLVVYLIDVAHRGALPVGVYHEVYPNQKYSWCSQLQNQPCAESEAPAETSEATPIVASKDAPEEAEKGTPGEAPKPIPTGGPNDALDDSPAKLELKEVENDVLTQIFEKIDKDKNGTLEKREILKGLRNPSVVRSIRRKWK